MACKLSYRYLGSSGLKVSNICLGTMTFAGEEKNGRPGQCSEEVAHKILDRFVEYGGNFIDTANVYQNGLSEQYIGNWLTKQKRDNLVIATKVRFGDDSSDPNACGLSRGHIFNAVNQSLKRLKTDYVDLYQIHCWDDAVPIEETLKALNDLVSEGKVRYLGACNLSGWQLQKIVEVSKQHNYVPFVTLQQQYSLVCRYSEYEVTEVCQREGIGMLIWGALKGGLLCGKVNRDTTEISPDTRLGYIQKNPQARNQSHPDFKDYKDNEQFWGIMDTMERIAKEENKSLPQIAIRWLLQKDTVSSVIIGVKTLEQLDDNVAAGFGWELSSQQMADLDTASAIENIYPYEMITRVNRQRRRNNACR